MKTTMRQAFEDCQLPRNPSESQLKLARKVINRMDKADDAAKRKRVRKPSSVSQPQVQEQ